MFKYLVAAALALSSTPANAQMMIGDGRYEVIKEAAKSICRTVMEADGSAGKTFERESSYLNLNPDEKLYLLSLCILYAQGRIDQIKAQ